MLTLDLADFIVELEEGTVKHVGTKTKGATVKLYHVTESDARAFGDQVKFVFDDGEGNHVEVAVDAERARKLAASVESVCGDTAE
jgi:hypothetical protein